MLSVVIATYNRAVQLARGINSLLMQSEPPDEIIVVDDGSTDETRDVFEKFGMVRYFYLDHPEPRISCHARNVGIRQAKGDFIVFSEPEILHVGDTLSVLRRDHAKNPIAALMADRVWNTGVLIAKQLTEDEYAHPERILNHRFAAYTEDSNMINQAQPNNDLAITGGHSEGAWVLGCARDQLIEMGGWDEELVGYGFDDFDLIMRWQYLYGKEARKCRDFSNIDVIHQWHTRNYPDMYEAMELNRLHSHANVDAGRLIANVGREWGKL